MPTTISEKTILVEFAQIEYSKWFEYSSRTLSYQFESTNRKNWLIEKFSGEFGKISINSSQLMFHSNQMFCKFTHSGWMASLMLPIWMRAKQKWRKLIWYRQSIKSNLCLVFPSNIIIIFFRLKSESLISVTLCGVWF